MQLSRRSLLAGGAVAAVTGCTPKHTPAPMALSGDALHRRDAAVRERLLVQAYDSAIAAFPALAPALAPLRQDHVLHQEALGSDLPTPSPGPAARSATEARLRIRALEQATARAHGAAALSASRQLAPLLASLSACEASHAVLL